MGKRVFLSNYCRQWRNRYIKLKQKHEFDIQYKDIVTYRSSHGLKYDFDYVISNEKYKYIYKDSLLRKMSAISGLSEAIIQNVLLDFFDLVSLSLLKEKKVLIHSICSIQKDNNKIELKLSKKYAEDCGIV